MSILKDNNNDYSKPGSLSPTYSISLALENLRSTQPYKQYYENNYDNELYDKWIVIIGTSLSHRDDVYSKIKKYGNHIIFVDTYVHKWAEPYADHWIIVKDLQNIQEIRDSLSNYIIQARNINPNFILHVITTYDDFYCQIASTLANEYNLICCDPKVVDEIQNKYTFRKTLYDANILGPKFIYFNFNPSSNLESIFEWIRDVTSTFTFPFIIKPIRGAGSQFVYSMYILFVFTYYIILFLLYYYLQKYALMNIQKIYSVIIIIDRKKKLIIQKMKILYSKKYQVNIMICYRKR